MCTHMYIHMYIYMSVCVFCKQMNIYVTIGVFCPIVMCTLSIIFHFLSPSFPFSGQAKIGAGLATRRGVTEVIFLSYLP